MFKLVFSLSSLSIVGYGVGFFNQIVIARHFGTSHELDLYLIALSIVNIAWFFSGPVSEVVIPNFFLRVKEGSGVGSEYFSAVLINIIFFSSLSSLFLFLVCPFLFQFFGYSSPSDYVELKEVTILLLPIIFLSAINHFFQGVLNSLGIFLVQSIGKIITAAVSVVFLTFFLELLDVKAIVFGLELGLFLLVLFQYYLISKNKVKLCLNFKYLFDLKYKNIGLLSIAYFATALLPFFEKNVFLNFGTGYVSTYNYAYVLMQIPLQVISSGILALSWTRFMESVHNNEKDKGLDKLYNISLNTFLVSGFIAIFLYNFSLKVIYIVFYGGMFNELSLHLTSNIFGFLVLSLPFFIFNALLSRAIVTILGVKYVALANFVAIVFSVIVLCCGEWLSKYEVAAAAPLISQFTLMLYYFYLYRRLYENKERFLVSVLFIFVAIFVVFTSFIFFDDFFRGNDFSLNEKKFSLILSLIPPMFFYMLVGCSVLFFKEFFYRKRK